jgi:hypothetical protein
VLPGLCAWLGECETPRYPHRPTYPSRFSHSGRGLGWHGGGTLISGTTLRSDRPGDSSEQSLAQGVERDNPDDPISGRVPRLAEPDSVTSTNL